MGLQYVELERDLTLLLWLVISMNDNLSQMVYTADCLSILSERTTWFLTGTRALIGNQCGFFIIGWTLGSEIVRTAALCGSD